MSIVIDDAHVQHLAEQLASAEGVSVTDVIREGLLSLAGQRGVRPRRTALRERLAMLAREVDALPPRIPADTRSDDEILGYDEHGVW
jgi:hypothetical protein